MSKFVDDPIVTSSRREAVGFACIWLTTLLYTVGYCFRHGFRRELDSSLSTMEFVFGWPDWVFWGIVLPWGVCTIVSIVFATLVMRDAPLGEERDSEDAIG